MCSVSTVMRMNAQFAKMLFIISAPCSLLDEDTHFINGDVFTFVIDILFLFA